MFDLTKNLQLEPQARKQYNIARILLHVVFLIVVIFVADRILFPSASLVFSFANVNSLKNTLVSPRASSAPGTLAKSSVAFGDKLLFNANPLGNFSDVSITFTADKNSGNLNGSQVTLRKSYQAFFYPTGDPVGFRNGTLLTTDDGKYYIASNGTLRKFSNTDIILQLGYSKSSFKQVSQNDLQYNKSGSDITDTNTYPDDTFFAIGDTYYQLKNQQLFPFVSVRAFLSQFDAIQAIIKNSDFLGRYPVSETPLGFADGTLGSSDISVFILSEGKSYPIVNADTFVQMGFDWNDVVAMDPEELGLYDRQKQFTHDQPHPDGTLFVDQKTKQYFVIQDGQKHPIGSAAVAETYSKQNPVVADIEESQQSVSCQLKKNFLSSGTYTCNVPLDSIGTFVGNDYEVSTAFANDAKISSIDTTFFTPLSWQNLRSSLSRIKESLRNNYIAPPQ
jgi:hypothetical protein